MVTPANQEELPASAWQATDEAVNILKSIRLKHKGEMTALAWIVMLHAEKKLRLEKHEEARLKQLNPSD